MFHQRSHRCRQCTPAPIVGKLLLIAVMLGKKEVHNVKISVLKFDDTLWESLSTLSIPKETLRTVARGHTVQGTHRTV